MRELPEERAPRQVRSFQRAFELQLFGTSAKSFVIDWISLFFITYISVWLLGKWEPLIPMYQWIWEENWFFIPYLFIPIAVPTFVLTLVKRDGISFWRYVALSLTYYFTEHVFEPFQERTIGQRLFVKEEKE